MTTYHFSGTVAWNRLGSFITTGRGVSTKSITDPSTGLVPAGLTQGGVAVTKITADRITGQWSFTTTDVPGVLMDWGAGPNLVGANELPGMILAAAAPTDAAVAALVGTTSSTRSAMDGRYVLDGALVYSAADYASLSAAITAVPAGSTIKLAPGTTYAANALTNLTKDLTFVGDGPRSSIIDAGANTYAFSLPALGAASRVTFRNIGFTGSTSAQVRLWRDRHMSARFIDCRFSGFTQFAIENSGTDLLCVRCEFDGDGTPGAKNAIFHQYGADRITLRDCTFRYLFRGLYCTDTNGPAKDVQIQGCTFDGGWFLLKTSGGTGSGGTVTYTSTTVTDTGASFAALAVNTTVRAMAVKQTGTLTTVARGRLTDTAANFTTAAVGRGDFLRVSGKFGIVDEVVSSTVVKIEKWIDSTTYQDCEPPATSTAYTVYGLVIGRVVSNTSTVITVDRWRDWNGTVATPASGTLYEVAPKSDYQCFVLRADQVNITGNTFKRSWADQVAPLNSQNVVVANNSIYDGQDVGITLSDTALTQGATVTGNRIRHQGTAGVFCAVPDATIVGNSITEPNWMSGPSDTYAGIIVTTGGDRALVATNYIKRINHPNALKAIHVNGTVDGVELRGNKTNGYTTHLVVTGTGVTNLSGVFEPNTVVSLVSSAVGPRGTFSGSGVPAVPASPGSTFLRTDGGASTSLYVKETSSASTTWAAK